MNAAIFDSLSIQDTSGQKIINFKLKVCAYFASTLEGTQIDIRTRIVCGIHTLVAGTHIFGPLANHIASGRRIPAGVDWAQIGGVN
jgi:hypothetical protein